MTGFDDFVINIRKIGHVVDLISSIFKIAPDGIKCHCASCIADMNIVVNRWSADVHFNLAFFKRFKNFFFA